MKNLLAVLFAGIMFSSSEIVTQKMISFDVFKTSFTVIWREEHHPIEPTEAEDTFRYYKDIYGIVSGAVQKIKTIEPSKYVPATYTDEVIEWAE